MLAGPAATSHVWLLTTPENEMKYKTLTFLVHWLAGGATSQSHRTGGWTEKSPLAVLEAGRLKPRCLRGWCT